ncbi:MAG: threonine synthase [Candidatus Izimaplasma sp.]|nr:threonine synthase [Candidatus Izimaplasma bacterium]
MVKSTRTGKKTTISKAILDGLAQDGGLYVFENIKQLNLSHLNDKSYAEVATKVFKHFLDEFDSKKVKNIVHQTYESELFKPSPVALKFKDKFGYLNLYNGETFAFKDMALSVLPQLIEEAKNINSIKQNNLVLTATSGDTGSAALSGFKWLKDDHVFVLYPTIGVSQFQELQMTSFSSDNLHVFAIDGNFDECQTIVKKLFNELKTTHIQLTSANSINIGRIIPQVAYYVYAYLKALKANKLKDKKQINFCVPTGNFGNIYAGYLAKKLGVPIHKLLIASNQNDVLDEFFKTGQYTINRSLVKTMSPSMDIIISSNLERYLYDILDGNTAKVKSLMTKLQNDKSIQLKEIKNDTTFYSNSATEKETLKTIRQTFSNEKELLDPHTAVAKTVYNKYLKETNDDTFTVIVSTASPFKFSDVVMRALGIEKKETLKESIQSLANYSKMSVDSRIWDILKNKTTKTPLEKSDAVTYLKKVIGDIDENQSSRN